MLSARNRRLISISSGLLTALLFVLFALKISGQVQVETNKAVKRFGGETVLVLVAKGDVKAGELVTSENTKLSLWPSVLLRKDAVDKDHVNFAYNKRASTPILANEPITESRLKEEEHKLDKLPSGYSAVTIEMDSVRALGGEIEVGMQVTVLATQNGAAAQLLAPGVEVISSSTVDADKKSGSVLGNSSSSDISWVTLAVPDELVAKLVESASANATYLVMPDDPAVFSYALSQPQGVEK